MKDWLSIGQISTRTGVSARALRLYEQIGLLGTALRGENGYRYYRADQVLLVKKVCDLKTLGFSLKEIKAFLEGDAQFDAQTMQQLVERRLKHIVGEEKSLATRKSRLSSLLTSLRTKTKALSERERKYVMELYQRVRIVVTGVENLDATASYIETY